VRDLCGSTDSLSKEWQKLKKTDLGETDLDAITSARQAREGQEADRAVVGALSGQIRTLREEVAALERARAGKEQDAGKHGGDELEGEDQATQSDDEATKSASDSEAAKRKELESWYRSFAGAAISPLPGWTIGDAGMSNRLVVITTRQRKCASIVEGPGKQKPINVRATRVAGT
jgi:hypothetical protein